MVRFASISQAAAAIVLASVAAHAADPVSVTVTGSPDDVMFEVETAIQNRGLVIDSVNDVGGMLERTKSAVGSDVTVFTFGKVFTFCSAEVSRKVMEADPMNLQYCPYRIFVAETPDAPGQVTIGHTAYPADVQPITDLLDSILKEAASGF